MANRIDFATAYRAIRMLANYGLVSPCEGIANEAVGLAAVQARFNRIEHRGGVECAKGAPDYRVCVRLHLDAARFRRRTGWAQRRAERLLGWGG